MSLSAYLSTDRSLALPKTLFLTTVTRKHSLMSLFCSIVLASAFADVTYKAAFLISRIISTRMTMKTKAMKKTMMTCLLATASLTSSLLMTQILSLSLKTMMARKMMRTQRRRQTMDKTKPPTSYSRRSKSLSLKTI